MQACMVLPHPRWLSPAPLEDQLQKSARPSRLSTLQMVLTHGRPRQPDLGEKQSTGRYDTADDLVHFHAFGETPAILMSSELVN